MLAAKKELAGVERKEAEFRKKERQERAAELDILAMSSILGTSNAGGF